MSNSTQRRLAIDGGAPTRSAPFPAWPIYGPEEERRLLEAGRSRAWGIGSPVIDEFERRFAEFQQADYAVSITNGTVALEMALLAAGVSYGDEVIVPPYTFVATASAALSIGAIPVFADIEQDTFNIDPSCIEPLITERTRAIIAVHIAGRPADLDRVKAIASAHDLRVIEDAAQAHGAEWQGRRVGAIGDLGTFSFQASKNVSTGEGGMVVSNDRELIESVWSIHNCGRIREGAWYQHERLGTNARLSALQCALGLAQMTRLPEHLALRERNAERLTSLLQDIPGIEPLADDERITMHAYHLYCFRYDQQAFGGRPRSEFLAALRAEGIPCAPGYAPLYAMNAIINASGEIAKVTGRPVTTPAENAARCPVNERICNAEGCWLTQNLLIGSESDIDDIAAAMAKIQAAWG